MKTLNLQRSESLEIPRPDQGSGPLESVRDIIEQVRADGDSALLALTEKLDSVALRSIRVPKDEIDAATRKADPEFKNAVLEVAGRIRAVAERQRLESWRSEVAGGVVGENVSALRRAGIYVPGGKFSYPSTVLMCAVPAQVAGVDQIALCVPPGKDGKVAAATLAAADAIGLEEVYSVGGAQAIAAMAFGTESVPRTDIVVGPGNAYVAAAKRELAGLVAIDSVAGPSEIAIVADSSADPVVIAYDLIAQAEHGPGGSFLVVSWEESVLEETGKALHKVLAEVDASDALRIDLDAGLSLVLTEDLDQAARAVNLFAPEHLELLIKQAPEASALFTEAGAIFVGRFSPVPFGDYAAGSNHVLPTGGAARWSSGLRTSTFQKTSYYVEHSKESLGESVPLIASLARAEGLDVHYRAVLARLESDE